MFVGTAALAIDVGFLFLAEAQARVASDSAVLAAMSVFEENETETVAQTRAIAAADAHRVGTTEHAVITAEDVIWATWDGTDLVEGVDFDDANAAVVEVAEPFDGFFSPFWGDFALRGRSESRAIVTTGPAGAVTCFLPIALPHCRYPSEDQNEVLINPDVETVNPGNTNDIAWAMPTSNPNTNDIRDQLLDFCGNTPEGLRTGDMLPIANGTNNAVISQVAAIINNTGNLNVAEPWPSEYFPAGAPARDGADNHGYTQGQSAISNSRYGGWVIGGPIPLVDAGGVPGDCTGQVALNQSKEIMGFTYGFLFDARTTGNPKGMKLQLDYVNDYDFGTEIDPDAIGNITADSPPQLVP